MPCGDGRLAAVAAKQNGGLSRRSCEAAKAETLVLEQRKSISEATEPAVPARGMARITSSKIHARSDRGNRGRTYVLVVQHRSTHKFESFWNCHAARAAATFRGATPHGVRTHINVANALKVRR